MRTASLLVGVTVVACLLAVAGCGDDDGVGPGVDAGGSSGDGGAYDAAAPYDAGPDVDAGGSTGDAGPDVDAGGSSADAGLRADAGMCTPVTIDPSHVGDPCDPSGAACPAGYACAAFSGVVLSNSCEIVCATTCDCPATTTCTPVTDKSMMTRHFCR